MRLTSDAVLVLAGVALLVAAGVLALVAHRLGTVTFGLAFIGLAAWGLGVVLVPRHRV